MLCRGGGGGGIEVRNFPQFSHPDRNPPPPWLCPAVTSSPLTGVPGGVSWPRDQRHHRRPPGVRTRDPGARADIRVGGHGAGLQPVDHHPPVRRDDGGRDAPGPHGGRGGRWPQGRAARDGLAVAPAAGAQREVGGGHRGGRVGHPPLGVGAGDRPLRDGRAGLDRRHGELHPPLHVVRPLRGRGGRGLRRGRRAGSVPPPPVPALRRRLGRALHDALPAVYRVPAARAPRARGAAGLPRVPRRPRGRGRRVSEGRGAGAAARGVRGAGPRARGVLRRAGPAGHPGVPAADVPDGAADAAAVVVRRDGACGQRHVRVPGLRAAAVGPVRGPVGGALDGVLPQLAGRRDRPRVRRRGAPP